MRVKDDGGGGGGGGGGDDDEVHARVDTRRKREREGGGWKFLSNQEKSSQLKLPADQEELPRPLHYYELQQDELILLHMLTCVEKRAHRHYGRDRVVNIYWFLLINLIHMNDSHFENIASC